MSARPLRRRIYRFDLRPSTLDWIPFIVPSNYTGRLRAVVQHVEGARVEMHYMKIVENGTFDEDSWICGSIVHGEDSTRMSLPDCEAGDSVVLRVTDPIDSIEFLWVEYG